MLRNVRYVLLAIVKIIHCFAFSVLFKWPDLLCCTEMLKFLTSENKNKSFIHRCHLIIPNC